MPDQRLLLFDIDGTLLDTGGAGLRSLQRGFEETFDTSSSSKSFPPLKLAGATDGGLTRFLHQHFDLELEAESIEAFYERYHGHLDRHLSESALVEGRVLPGVQELLTHLRDDTDHALGLLTGNIQRGAWTKVRHYQLNGFFEFGAFGDDHHDRNELGPIARKRALTHTGQEFPDERVFIIGDTPKDIACARACGAVAVAVATGTYSADDLASHEPDHLLEDFADHLAVLEILAH